MGAGPADDVGDWIDRWAAAREADDAAVAVGPEHRAATALALVASLVLACACGALLWRPEFVVFDLGTGRGGIETGWRSPGADVAVYAGQAWVVTVLLVPLVVLTLDDLRRIARDRHLRWAPHRTVLASVLLGAIAFLALTVSGFAGSSIALPGVAAQVVVATILLLAVTARRTRSLRRLVGWGIALLAGAAGMSSILALDNPSGASQCTQTPIDGLSASACAATAHRTLVHGMWVDGLLWISAAVVLAVAARRWTPAVQPGGRPPDRRAKRVAVLAAGTLLAVTPVISVVSEVAVVRGWCSSAPVVQTFTRPPSCATDSAP